MADPVPFVFALGGDVAESLEWSTDVNQSPATGVEQRRRLRTAPRVTQAFDGMQSGQVRRWLENLLHATGTGPWDIPLLADAMVLAEDAEVGALALAGDASWLRFVAGGRALLSTGDPRTAEVVQIDSAGSDGLVLSTGTTRAWHAGACVRPLYAGRFDTMPTLARFTGDTVSYSADARLEDVMDLAFDHGLPLYRDYPVLERFVDWSSDPAWTPVRLTSTQDEGAGQVFVNDAIGAALPELTVQLGATAREDIAALLGLLWTMCGRWQPVWVPSRTLDLAVEAAAASGANTLTVDWSGLADIGVVEHRRDLRIALHDGTVIYRRITAIDALTDSQELVTLDSPIVTGFAVGDVAAVSFMALMRQNADVNRLNWFDCQTLQTEMALKGVPHGL